MLQLVAVEAAAVDATEAAAAARGAGAAAAVATRQGASRSRLHARQLLQGVHHAGRELLQLGQAQVHRLQGRLHGMLALVHLLQAHGHVLHPAAKTDSVAVNGFSAEPFHIQRRERAVHPAKGKKANGEPRSTTSCQGIYPGG